MMNLKMEVFSPDLELLGILETYTSFLVSEWAFQAGEFTLDCPLTESVKSILKPDNIIWFYDSTAGIIESLITSAGENGMSITLRGSLLAGVLGRRILWGLYNISGSPTKIMYDVVTDCAITPTRGDITARKISGLTTNEQPTDSRSIRKQSTGENLLDFLSDVGQSNTTAFGVDFDPVTPSMIFWARPGIDRTIEQSVVDPVFYSTELDDVLSSEYIYDSSQYSNLTLVAGEGEGNDRTMVVVTKDGSSPTSPSHKLPEGYIQLEYIESNGSQYINTGFSPTSFSKIEVDAIALSHTTACDIFGTRDAANGTFLFISVNTAGRCIGRWGTSVNANFSTKIDATERHIFVCDQNTFKIDDNSIEFNKETFSMGNPLYLFARCVNANGVSSNYVTGRLYYAKLYEGNTICRNFIPCLNTNNIAGLYDLVNGNFYMSVEDEQFIAGPEITDKKQIHEFEPSNFSRRECFVDARDLQKDADTENPMTDEQYQAVLQDRGREKLAIAQLIQSFEATVRTQNPTYEYGKDFFLGDTITVKDERLGISVNGVVEGVERSISANGEDMVFTFGYSAPTITEKLRKELR